MKKITIILFATILLSACGDKTKTLEGKEAEVVLTGSTTYHSVCAIDYTVAGMHYKVLNSSAGNIFVINVTKDSLEVSRLSELKEANSNETSK